MGLNFDDYIGFQPKIVPAQRYATQCMQKKISIQQSTISRHWDLQGSKLLLVCCIMKKKYSINLAGSVFIYNLGGSVFIYNFINFSLGLNMSQVCMRLVWLPIRQGLLNKKSLNQVTASIGFVLSAANQKNKLYLQHQKCSNNQCVPKYSRALIS